MKSMLMRLWKMMYLKSRERPHPIQESFGEIPPPPLFPPYLPKEKSSKEELRAIKDKAMGSQFLLAKYG
jgi:hypothetical protein